MRRDLARRQLVCGALAFWSLAACSPHGNGGAHGPAPSSSPARPVVSPLPSNPVAPPSASPGPTGSPLKITVRGRKVGSRYIFVTEQKGNRKVYVLRADSESGVYFGSDTGVSNFVNPHVIFFGPHGQRFIADAPRGTALEKDKTIRMSGGVHGRTADGKTLSSDTLLYADSSETAYGDGNVVLTSPSGVRLVGDRLVWDLRTGHIDVRGAQ
ncbi:MAG: LPS export ABC transporter periplasmic protein LptC [Candidatus Eremiobacteraeota bacterium]|nr:LPS export ABC transporter periplasmic protein LptC [Candidatus Eremiobacteraeota bacterium]